MNDISYTSSCGEENARLLFDLCKKHGAVALGAISNFFGTNSDFCCPCCHRSKENIARVDKNGNLLCQFVVHHDHFGDTSSNIIRSHRGDMKWRETRELHSLGDNFSRFADILICSDCNVAEGSTKNIFPYIPPAFSFSPIEISQFIIVANNRPHTIDREKVSEIFSSLEGNMKILGDALRNVKSYSLEDDSFEQIGGAAWRVLKDIHRKRNGNNHDT